MLSIAPNPIVIHNPSVLLQTDASAIGYGTTDTISSYGGDGIYKKLTYITLRVRNVKCISWAKILLLRNETAAC